MRHAILLSLLFLTVECFPLAVAMSPGQTIPNPNQERLGMPQNPVPPVNGSSNGRRSAQSKYAHAEALREAEELCTQAQQLRDELKAGGEFVLPASAIADAQKIEKLAHKLRMQLKN